MIKNINCSSPYLAVTGGTSAPYIGNNGSGAGMVRFNATNQSLDVFDGGNWMPFTNNYVTLEMSLHGSDIMQWAARKMEEEKRILALAEQYPAVKDAKEQLDIIMALVKQETT
jgi:hypothetical protein